jgi:hypothetical protein
VNTVRASLGLLPATLRHRTGHRGRFSVIPPRAHLYQNRAVENIMLERCGRAGVLAGAGIPARLSRRSKGCPSPPVIPRRTIALD